MIKISIFYGKYFHAISSSGLGYWKAPFPCFIVYGDPNIFSPSISMRSLSRKWAQDLISFRINYFVSWVMIVITLQGYLSWRYCFLDGFIRSSRAISWLPAITTLCLNGNTFKYLIKLRKCSSLPYLVKSPAWINRSPLIPLWRMCSNCYTEEWVSETATILKLLFMAYFTINFYKYSIYRWSAILQSWTEI